MIRGNCLRIRPPTSVDAAAMDPGPILGCSATGAVLFVGLLTPPTFSCSLFEAV